MRLWVHRELRGQQLQALLATCNNQLQQLGTKEDRIIYERDPAKDVTISFSQQHITEEMQEFNDAWVDKLPDVQLNQLKTASVPQSQA